MTTKRNILPGIALCGVALSFPVAAYDVEQISINGFGSIVAGQTLDSDETLYGNDNDLSFQNESRFALQVAAPIGEKFSATAQIMARGEDDFNPTFEWAYLSYQATDSLIVMAGRQRFNLYKYSDYVDVGYAYHWIRPPQGVYSIPFSSGDGLGFLYNTALGDFDFNFVYKFIGADISDYVPSGTTGVEPAPFEVGMSHLLNFDFTWNDLNFGANYGLVPKLTYEAKEFDALQAALDNAIGVPAANEIMEDIRVDEETLNFFGGYVGYDPGAWFVLAEYTYLEFDDANALANQESLYLSAGVRINQFTIHATYGMDENDPSSDVYKSIADPRLSAIVKGAVSKQEEDSETYSLGVRWEVESGVALKADYTTYDDDINDGADADLISAGVDFVF